MSQDYYDAKDLFDPKTDSKAWAKRIIYRAERNDKSLTHIQILFAYEAMGKSVPKAADAI